MVHPKRMRIWIALIALAASCAVAQAEKETFQYNFKTGQTIHSHIVMNTSMSMGKSVMNMDTSMHVDEAKADGSAALTTKVDGGDIKMMGMKMAIPGRGKEFKMTVSKFGKRMDMGDAKTSVVVQEFPDHPVAVGESWDGSVQVQGGKMAITVNAHFTFDSVKTVDGHKLAHLLVVEDGGTTGRGAMTIHATGWMDWDIAQAFPTSSHMEGTEDTSGMSSTFTSDQTSTIEG
jgi:hypothetical protein